jgi:hypothetical protein
VEVVENNLLLEERVTVVWIVCWYIVLFLFCNTSA